MPNEESVEKAMTGLSRSWGLKSSWGCFLWRHDWCYYPAERVKKHPKNPDCRCKGGHRCADFVLVRSECYKCGKERVSNLGED